MTQSEMTEGLLTYCTSIRLIFSTEFVKNRCKKDKKTEIIKYCRSYL